LWNETIDAGQLAQSLDDLADLGADHVGINVWWFQDDLASTVISPDFTRYSASDASVIAAIDAAHARGMRVMLKPIVDLRGGGGWRGQIPGGSPWFFDPGGYADFINHFADLAEGGNVEQFCVGTELVSTAGQEANWRAVIAGVRSRYSGALTYAAQHGGSSAVTAATINWWDAVDYFGLDAYYPLTGKNDPTLAELQSAWSGRSAQIAAWRGSIDPAKPVILTEIGYRSWDGTNRHPASGDDKSDANVDEAEQADCYEAVLSQSWKQDDWLAGAYWWNWEVDPDPTWEADNWYPIQGKPALAVLESYYHSAPGDANGDGHVNVFDLAILANHYGRPSGATWLHADFTGDGAVNVFDLAELANHYTGTAAALPVPEPLTLTVLAIGTVGVLRRRGGRGELQKKQEKKQKQRPATAVAGLQGA